jgi:hypothetical protein
MTDLLDAIHFGSFIMPKAGRNSKKKNPHLELSGLSAEAEADSNAAKRHVDSD